MIFTITPNEDAAKINLHEDGKIVAVLVNDLDAIQDAISRRENVLAACTNQEWHDARAKLLSDLATCRARNAQLERRVAQLTSGRAQVAAEAQLEDQMMLWEERDEES